MCGIFGYIGPKDPLTVCLAGLELLEYRGYDSTGIAGIEEGEIVVCKEVGKLANLKGKLTLKQLQIAIGHTRWATHGKVTHQNAHPHLDAANDIALVHNGIIENFDELRDALIAQGVLFRSETDTEVIAQLVGRAYRGNLLHAVQEVTEKLKGHFAFALIHKAHPKTIIASARSCPLSIGVNEAKTEAIISSDPNAFFGEDLNVVFLTQGEVAEIQEGSVAIFDQAKKAVMRKSIRLNQTQGVASKEGYAHFMLKEIHEQPTTIRRAMEADFSQLPQEFQDASMVWFIGCGTSAHAGAIGALFLEDVAKICAHAEIASEARYRIVPKGAVVVAMSQSGETADTIAAVRELRAKGVLVLGICNVKNSTLTREADATIFLDAGVEMSVCSTKAFTSQITILYQFAHFMAKRKAPAEFLKIPTHIEAILAQSDTIQKLAKKYSRYNDFFFMGRRYMFFTCLEAALKLKEISYVNANGYPAGELKHGPIALIDTEFPVIAFCANHQTEEKMLSNLQEVKARGAPTLAIAPKEMRGVAKVADDCIWVPFASDLLAPFASAVVGQLLAYYIALERKAEIDQPRNLAKSVTVE